VAGKPAGVYSRGCGLGRCPSIRHFERCRRRSYCVDPAAPPSCGAASRRFPGPHPWYSPLLGPYTAPGQRGNPGRTRFPCRVRNSLLQRRPHTPSPCSTVSKQRANRCASSFVISQPRRRSISRAPGCSWISTLNLPSAECPCVSSRPMPLSATCFALKEERIGLVASTALRQ
jgi:hypothetical protein